MDLRRFTYGYDSQLNKVAVELMIYVTPLMK